MLPALRISLGIAWLVVVAAEMIAVKSGLGYLILDSRNALRMDFVMDAMATIGLIGIGLDRMISQFDRMRVRFLGNPLSGSPMGHVLIQDLTKGYVERRRISRPTGFDQSVQKRGCLPGP